WKEVLTRWAKLMVQNPAVPRRFQQIVEGARGSGFFFEDTNGNEMFAIQMPGPMADYFGVGFVASVEGLSLATSIMPGLSPIAAVAVDQLRPDIEEGDWITDILFPFGAPDTTSVSGIASSITPIPSWLRKIGESFTAHPNFDRTFGNTYMEVIRQKI